MEKWGEVKIQTEKWGEVKIQTEKWGEVKIQMEKWGEVKIQTKVRIYLDSTRFYIKRALFVCRWDIMRRFTIWYWSGFISRR